MTKPKPNASTFMAFRAKPRLARAMQKLHADDGISLSEQMRRGVVLFLTKKGYYTEKKEKQS